MAPSATLTVAADAKDALLIPLALVKQLNLPPSESSSASAAAAAIDVAWKPGATTALAAASQNAEGIEAVVRLLLDTFPDVALQGSDKAHNVEITSQVNLSLTLAGIPFTQATHVADALDQQLALRTYLTARGHLLTAADLCMWGAFRSSPPLMGLTKKGQHVHLARWLAHMDTRPACLQAAEELRVAKAGKAKSASKQASSFALFLPDAKEGQVVTRFPPEPSGYLHIGHAKAAILNQFFARQYKGKLLIRFDDTNPSKEKVEFEDSIVEDLALLGIKGDAVSHTSDHFDELHRLVIQLIKQGDAYADDTPQEQMRAERMDGIASARRGASVEENMARFAEMTSGSDEGRKWCLRAKMSVDDANKAMRDPVIYRTNDVPHHRTGTRCRVYPTYDFACPVVDSLEGVTHALRTNEYIARNPQYQWFLERLKLRRVDIWDFSRLNFVYTLLSKRKLQWFVDRGYVTGWDDPRFPTVRGIRRRGMTIECIQQFILATGPSNQVINMEWDAIWSANKRILDPVVPRFTALETKNLVKAHIEGVSGTQERSVAKHKKNAELGTKTVVYGPEVLIEQEDAASFVEGEKVTLMDWGNVVVESISKDGGSGVVSSLRLRAAFDDEDYKKTKKVTWLATADGDAAAAVAAAAAKDKTAEGTANLVAVELLDFDYLITKKKLEEEDRFEDHLTPVTEFRTAALADANVCSLREGEAIQFERKGFFILDRLETASASGRREFIRIPDGSAESSRSKAEATTAAAAAAAAGKSGGGAKATAAAAGAAGAGAAAPAHGAAGKGDRDAHLGLPEPHEVSKMYAVRKVAAEDVEEVAAAAERVSGMYAQKPIV